VIHQIGLQPVLGVHNNRDILRVSCSGCLSFDPDEKNFSSEKKMMWFGLAGFLLVRKAFSTAAQVVSFTYLFL
jgi:hypothetical protein